MFIIDKKKDLSFICTNVFARKVGRVETLMEVKHFLECVRTSFYALPVS